MKKLEQYGILTGRGKHHEEVMYGLALVYNICNTRMSNYLKQYNLSVGKFNLLVAIKVHGKEEGLSQVEISKHLIVTPSNMTKLIDKLEREGRVIRSAMSGDRRVNLIKITAPTAKLIDSIWSEYSKTLKDLMVGLDLEDQAVLASKLLKWLNALV